jgi:hypothetical protein
VWPLLLLLLQLLSSLPITHHDDLPDHTRVVSHAEYAGIATAGVVNTWSVTVVS